MVSYETTIIHMFLNVVKQYIEIGILFYISVLILGIMVFKISFLRDSNAVIL
jgi:hypothetical protein